MSRGATLAARWLDGPQPISNHPVGLGFPHPARRYRPGGSAFSSLGCWSCRDVKGFLIQRWELILPRCGGTSALSRGATLAARRLHEPQPISNHTVRLEFPHPAGRYRPGRYVFSSPGCWSCRYIEGFLLRGWELILPGVRWLYVRSPANLRWASGTGVSTSCGLFRPGGPSFSSPGYRSCNGVAGFVIGGWKPILPGVCWLCVRSPANQRPASGVRVSTPCEAVSTRRITAFVPRMSEL